MRIGHIHVQNYRGLKDVEASIGKFACIIGENNAGKSSLLQAFTIFLNGKRLDEHNYYDETQPIVVTVRFDDVTDNDLAVLAEEHHPRIKKIIYDGSLTLVRRFPLGESPKLRCKQMIPVEPRFREKAYNKDLKGMKGKDIENFLTNQYPELDKEVTRGVNTLRDAKALIKDYADNNLSPDNKELEEADLPTGIAQSVTSLLPEPIYVAAVKDFADEIKAKQSATFGKLLGVLLAAIEPKLSEAQEVFKELEKHLNRIDHPDGSQTDDRLDDVKRIEDTVATYLREIFPQIKVELKIPPPEVKTILSNAGIEISEGGVKGNTDTIGDGLKRSITFAIFRSYVELSKSGINSLPEHQNRFLFLFEEPELYLHPIVQRTLFEALGQISQRHQVLISTHSPFFFQPENTDMFIKMKKASANPKPCSELVQINLSDMSKRDLFQIISFETSNTAFFSKKAVLVEGDSELIAIPHIARTLCEDWDFVKNHIAIIKINGKDSIRRFKKFFTAFDIPIVVITDLDILVDSFKQLGVEQDIKRLQSTLLQKVDAEKETLESGSRRIDILRNQDYTEILCLKRELLAKLRMQGIYVWEKGCLDDYYLGEITSKHGKPQLAYNFCQEVKTREAVLKLCEEIPIGNESRPEFEVIFSSIFDENTLEG